MRCAVSVRCISDARIIYFLQTRDEQRTPGAWKGHPAHPVLFVFPQKTDKFRFAANGMRTIHRWSSAGSRSRPHISSLDSRTIHERLVNHLAASCIRGFLLFLRHVNLFHFRHSTHNILSNYLKFYPERLKNSAVLFPKCLESFHVVSTPNFSKFLTTFPKFVLIFL